MSGVDLIVRGGAVVPLTAPEARAEALAVVDGRVVAVGSEAEVLGLAGDDTRMLDVEGGAVLPGFYDAHAHLVETGLVSAQLDLSRCASVGELLDAIGRACGERERGSWLVCSGRWHEGRLREQRLPTRAELDRVAPDNPVFLPRGGHLAVVNSRALAAAGIAEDVADPAGGRYERDEAGALTGVVVEDPALRPIQEALPPPSEVDLERAATTAIARFHAAGVTSLRDAWALPSTVRCLTALRDAGRLTLRTRLLVYLDPATGEAQLQEVRAQRERGGDRLRVAGAKIVLDGGVEGAWLREEHIGVPGYHGESLWEDEALVRVLLAAARLGVPIGFHVVGDAALDQALRAIERVDAVHQVAGRRWVLEHAFLADAGQIERARALGLIVTVQPHLLHELASALLERFGAQRTARVFPVRAWLDAGVPVAAGSDSPVATYAPMSGVQWLATRESVAGTIGPEHAMTAWEALRAYTVGAAGVTFDEREQGTLEPGKLADFVVLDRDPLAVPPGEIGAIAVRTTVVGGEIVTP